MKAHVIPNIYKKAVSQYLEDNEKAQAEQITRRVLKAVCYALNYHYDFGKKRLLKIISAVQEIVTDEEDRKDGVLWDRIDMKLEELGLNFEWEEEGK